jgi:DNA-binding transcriptional MerR regulator
MKQLDIGDVAALSGIRPSALRHYEEMGLIAPISRHGLRRQYGPEVLLQLKLIAMAKSAGFSLAEMTGMLSRDGVPDLPRDVFVHKAEDIDRRIAELATMRDTLRHIAQCSAPSHLECPSFRRLLGLSPPATIVPASQSARRKIQSA